MEGGSVARGEHGAPVSAVACGEHGARLQIRVWVSGVGGGPCGWRTSMSGGALLGFVPRCERQLGGLRARPGPGCLWPIPNVPAF